MKTSQPLWRISVTTTLEAEDAVAEMMASHFGKAAAAYFNVETGVSIVSVFENERPSPNKTKSLISAALGHIAGCGLKIGTGLVEIAKVKREDWKESWKRHFHPLEIDSSLLVKPSWSKQRPKKGQAVVILDPGLSFGTGQHPTTSFCLSEVARIAKSGNNRRLSFLDIGTGSGILAISAAKLGYSPVHAFDFDPESVRVAKANAIKNKVGAQCKITRGDITKLAVQAAKKYDLVCANLISNLLIAERKRTVNRIKPGGTLVLAGILAVEFSEVESAFKKSGMKLVEKRTENEWCSGSFCFA